MIALQEAGELFSGPSGTIKSVHLHAKHVTIMPKVIQLARHIWGDV